MKINKTLLVLTAFVCSLFLTIACSKDEEVTVKTEILGKAEATPSTVKNGDEITLGIGGIISSSSTATINGKEYYPVIHYLVDGSEVAVSTDKKSPFNATYKVNDLSVGEHTLSVRITPSESGAIFENKVSESKITVVE